MFTNDQRQKERTGKYGSPRLQYLQELVAQFQNASTEEGKEKIVANLGNFAYDPYNYTFLRQLNVLELFLDCLTEPNERLVQFALGGICNACADPTNAAVVIQCDGIPLVIQCLSSPVRNTALMSPRTGIQYISSAGSQHDTCLIPHHLAEHMARPATCFIPHPLTVYTFPARMIVNYALGSLYYLCSATSKGEILKPEVVDAIKRFAAAGSISVCFGNLAQSLLDKLCI
ncbi:hypothetical protein OROHE_010787 [Orobanche hederae]